MFLCLMNLERYSNLQKICILSRKYSVFPPSYIKPIFKKEEQEYFVKNGQMDSLKHAMMKPAPTGATCSEFHDAKVEKFINYIMKKGNKVLAQELMEKTFENIKRLQLEKYNNVNEKQKLLIELNPKAIMHNAISNVKPIIHLTKVKRGGITYQVPTPLTEKKQQFLAIKWFIEAAKVKDRSCGFEDKLAKELINAYNNQGSVLKRKQDLHKQCEANRAFAHFRWLK
ncbi:small ribosomal subunit protein uS7m [Prorops nasuta]|uniref:small ribosomal subunit protein uS7m n=1 Tax=Prorops nasuta TaxID=863751 RepID=UPI0034CDFFDC